MPSFSSVIAEVTDVGTRLSSNVDKDTIVDASDTADGKDDDVHQRRRNRLDLKPRILVSSDIGQP